jgi:hypothetical protein
MAPQGEVKSIVNSAEDGDKIVFEQLACPFGDVAMVAVWGDLLVSHPVFHDAFFKFCQTLIVQSMML